MKLKKCLSAALAMIVAISAASVPSLATMASLTVDGTYVDVDEEISVTENRKGVLANGLEYEIIQMTESWREEIHGGFDADTFTLQWSGKKEPPSETETA